MTLVFFDTEFTGLHKNTTLMSIGLVSQEGDEFYAELTDYDKTQVDEWLEKNVIANFSGDPSVKTTLPELKEQLGGWIDFVKNQNSSEIIMVSDCMAYDWVLFNDIFGHAFNLPKGINYIPVDICTMFRDRGIDPDISREEFVREYQVPGAKHNALYDAYVIKACYEKLKAIPVLVEED